MQWLIDIAKEAMAEWYAEFGGIIYRGPYTTDDFTKTNFTFDETWHLLDLSDIIPIDVKYVYLIHKCLSSYAGSWAYFRKPSVGTNWNVAHVSTIIAGLYHTEQFFVAVDENRCIEYMIQNTPWPTFRLSVRAWTF